MDIYKQIRDILEDADAILIGASNGLSISEGLHLFANNDAFRKQFGDFQRQYGITCLLQGMCGRWPTETEKWRFWSRAIHHYCNSYQPTQIMENLKALVGEKEYFVVTSNGECHFEKSGFAPERIYEVEGTWLTMQCTHACHDTLYSTEEVAERIYAAEQTGPVPEALLPKCPECGGTMTVHMDGGGAFLHDMAARKRFAEFLARWHGKKLVILELGIGARNQLIKAPLMQITAAEPKGKYITVNLGEVYIPEAIREKSIGVDGGIAETLKAILETI